MISCRIVRQDSAHASASASAASRLPAILAYLGARVPGEGSFRADGAVCAAFPGGESFGLILAATTARVHAHRPWDPSTLGGARVSLQDEPRSAAHTDQ